VGLDKIRQDIQGEMSMTPQEQERLQACISEMAQILYNNTPTEKITTLEEIEKAVRQQMMEHISPKIVVY
jgi:NADPH:quinone reductase-like Zn-dependent oxidoreductase